MPLTIYNQEIDKISGPVSVYILKPNKIYFKNYTMVNMKLPVYILFGDKHESDKYMCSDCNCINNGCCYKINDPNFLRILDKIASPNYPVDFFAETFQHGLSKFNMIRDEFKYPLSSIIYNYLSCRKTNQDSFYKSNCPTQNIRWQSGDVRVKNVLSNIPYFENFISDLYITNKKMFNINSISNTFTINKYKDALENLKKKHTEDSIKKYILIINKILNCDENSLSTLTKQESLINKQILKFPSITQEAWSSRTIKYLCKNIQTEQNTDKAKELNTLIYNYFISVTAEEQYLVFENIKDKVSTLSYSIFFNLNSLFVDIYVILRSIKPPTGDTSAILSIAYFGNEHIKNMVNFLTQELKYELILKNDHYINSQQEPDNLRCITINENINIDNILKEYGYIVPYTGPINKIPFNTPQPTYINNYIKRSKKKSRKIKHKARSYK